MNWLLILIKYGPSIFKIIKDIIDLIKKAPESKQPQFKNQFGQTFAYYTVTKDKSHLRHFRAKLSEKVNEASQDI